MRATKDTTYTTPEGKQVDVKKDEKVTKGGIIIGDETAYKNVMNERNKN